ncbi:beta-glucuronosyltransferase GlcAT14B-like [Impatiens glandulifera]|uniref:beta-glucuronosyltransferase GlcAT14B-like n=1 Tax=Impatiens glandulifera TaxID=253017 RepID=UPI001FB1238E|nr:beta-glucuronosyltransferase GlcAT14B-like [Impatiens glandulifera]
MGMRKAVNGHSARIFSDRKWILPFFASILISITLFTAVLHGLYSSSYYIGDDQLHYDLINPDSGFHESSSSGYFVESDIWKSFNSSSSDSKDVAPRFAYLISGTKGDSQRMMRTLQAVYHPRNQYVLHMDLEAPARERLNLTMLVKNDPTFREVENVRVMAQSNLVTYKGPTMVACTLQAIAILLKESSDWDWFINLSASDYPLVTQDDLLYVFSNLSRNLNFIEHEYIRGWKLTQRAKPIMVDPGLYLSKKSNLALTTQRRSLPTSFKLFTGSAWVMLTRSFVEYCILGWDNLPRTILMYYANFISSPEGYFHTVICNNDEFKKTAISHDLHYIAWDNPPKQHPLSLTMKEFDKMVNSSAPFARKFPKNDPVLDKIDKELLGRKDRFSNGAWCIGNGEGGLDPCSERGDDSVFRPGLGAERLQKLMNQLLSDDFNKLQCQTPT